MPLRRDDERDHETECECECDPRVAECMRRGRQRLPKRTPELNAMDQLRRELKRVVAANRQAPHIDALATSAMLWVVMLPPTEARRKAG
jgi:hypothetical protein